jgi:2-polyprenyl-6-hydroxyphenyl methylase/3-demethylubiquinone-9 3-methyltransferase
MERNSEPAVVDGVIQKLIGLYAPFGPWRQFYARFRVMLARFDQIEECLPPGGRVLDLGCGHGVQANYMALTKPERTVLGIDLDDRRIVVAQRTAEGRRNITFIQGDFTQVALPECNAVMMSDVLHHLPYSEQEKVLSHVHSLLVENGLFLIQDVNTQPRWKYVCSLAADLALYGFERVYYRSSNDWAALLASEGFRDIQVLRGDQKTIFARVSYIAYKRQSG